MHIHILGICGTFMGSLALLAKEKGFAVTGSDTHVYPPMSLQLESQGIQLIFGYEADQLDKIPFDKIIIGNVMARGKYPVIEETLNRRLGYISGPQWIAENILGDRHVIAVAGTHGKTTTASMMAWILTYAGLNPGFLIGGIPQNFGISARLGTGKYFVIEADEYDSAFYDKRSKFLHYRPEILILNNLEFDHADIFPDLKSIQKQFEYLIRTVPQQGLIIKNYHDKNLTQVLNTACFTPIETFGKFSSKKTSSHPDWSVRKLALSKSAHAFNIYYKNQKQGEIIWDLLGEHNQLNALAAIAAARQAGVPIQTSLQALNAFKSVKRRLEIKGEKKGMIVYEDFAHHPTAIQTTLAGLRQKVGGAKIIVVLECASHTMRMGIHQKTLAKSLNHADQVIFLRLAHTTQHTLDIDQLAQECRSSAQVLNTVEQITEYLAIHAKTGHHIVIMSNGGFGGLSQKLLDRL